MGLWWELLVVRQWDLVMAGLWGPVEEVDLEDLLVIGALGLWEPEEDIEDFLVHQEGLLVGLVEEVDLEDLAP